MSDSKSLWLNIRTELPKFDVRLGTATAQGYVNDPKLIGFVASRYKFVGKMIGAAPESRGARVPLERVMFGSHAPYFPIETAILKLIESPLNATQLHAIMQGNARRLLPAV